MSIKRCTCHHPYQDRLYGEYQRVHTEGGGGKVNKRKVLCCTVCKNTFVIETPNKKKKKGE